jgi:hypothetical protein
MVTKDPSKSRTKHLETGETKKKMPVVTRNRPLSRIISEKIIGRIKKIQPFGAKYHFSLDRELDCNVVGHGQGVSKFVTVIYATLSCPLKFRHFTVNILFFCNGTVALPL